MNRLIASLAAFTALTAAASAADLPRRAPPPVFVPVPVFTWTGFYAGFNAGYGFGTEDSRTPTVLAVTSTTRLFSIGTTFVPGQIGFSNRHSNDGFVGGGQVGYNYQFTPGSGVVIGVEADAQYADFGRQRNRFGFVTNPVGGALVPGTVVFNPSGLTGLDFFGTVRGRLGYAFDRTLLYGTGGLAYGSGGPRNFAGSNTDDFRTGYVVGGGVEYALPTDSFLNFFRASAVTLKIEGLYVNLDRPNGLNGAFATNAFGQIFTVTSPLVAVLSGGNVNRRNDDFAVVRAGVNYKFGSY